jgi:cytochrome c-type biogenesis protein CcmH
VSDAALQNFKKAYALDPLHPGARYYLAVHDAQNNKLADALDKWINLYQDSEADAPFMPLLSERIKRSAEELDRNVTQILDQKQPTTNAPGPSREDMQAAAEMTAADRREMIENMVAGLAERMQASPEFDGLMRLGKAYATQQKFTLSADAYERAAQLQPDNVDPLVLQALSLVRGNDSKEPPQIAIDVYRKVLALDDTVAEAHWYIGVSEAISGNTEQARSHWQRMLDLIPPDSTLYTNVTNAIKSLSPATQN